MEIVRREEHVCVCVCVCVCVSVSATCSGGDKNMSLGSSFSVLVLEQDVGGVACCMCYQIRHLHANSLAGHQAGVFVGCVVYQDVSGGPFMQVSLA